jgi:hypothetical protein
VFAYNDEIDQALLPYPDDLTKLLHDRNPLDDLDCPANAWINKYSKGKYGHLAFSPCFRVSALDVCHIESWYDKNVPGAREYCLGLLLLESSMPLRFC